MTDIAVFPIPNCVTFPGTVFPLHVFEPRYRTMVQACAENGMPVAVCHVEKTVHPGKEDQPLVEALNSNQATYKPVKVASAGRCEIVKVLEDGRLMVNVHITARYKTKTEIQTLPYLIVEAEPYVDDTLSSEKTTEAELLKDKLLHRLLALTADKPIVQKMLKSEEWQLKSPTDFSFELFSVLQTDADVMQDILEMTSPIERLKTGLDLLKDVPAQI